MQFSLKIAGFVFLAGCTAGVQSNIEGGSPSDVLATRADAAEQIDCIDDQMAHTSFQYSVVASASGWDLTVLVFGGPVVGWFPKASAVRSGQTINYYMDAADFNLDAFGVRSVVLPILQDCA